MLHHRRNYRTAIVISALVLAPTCHPNRPDDLRVFVPEIAPDVAHHLACDNPEQLRRFARKVGLGALVRASAQLRTAPPTQTAAEFVHVESRLAPYMGRLADVMVSEFGFEEFRIIQSAYWRRPVSERMEAVLLWRDYTALNTAT